MVSNWPDQGAGNHHCQAQQARTRHCDRRRERHAGRHGTACGAAGLATGAAVNKDARSGGRWGHADLRVEPAAETPQKFARFIATEVTRNGELLSSANFAPM